MDKLACYFMTRNIYQDCIPSIKSLLHFNPGVKVILFIEDNDPGFELPENVRCVNISDQTFFPKDGPNASSKWTYMVCMKTQLCKLLPDVDRILFLDCDTIIREDILELWEMDLEGKYFAAVEEHHREFPVQPYYNAGVMMFNLEMFRDGMADQLQKLLNTMRLPFCEQDALSLLCKGKTISLPAAYNITAFTITNHNISIWIRHYAAEPNWREYPEVRIWRDKK